MAAPRRRLGYGLLLGLALLTGLVAWQGVTPLAAALREAGWVALLVPVYFLLPMAAASVSWSYLFTTRPAPPAYSLYYGTWVGLGVNWLLPVAMVGGELVRVRLLVRRAWPGSLAAASVMADKTLQLVTQVAFGLAGLFLLPLYLEEGGTVSLPWLGMLAVLAVVTAGLIGFYRRQRAGVFAPSARWLERISRSPALSEIRLDAEAADAALARIYGCRGRLALALVWRLAFRVAWAGEVWLALWILGYPVGLVEALIIESLTQAARAAAFLIPGGLGAQDAAVVMVAVLLGLPGSAGLGVAVIKRFREIAIGLPALAAWQFDEGRAAFGRRDGR